MSTKRYIGKICELHPELQGERLSSNRRCVRCHRERRGRWKVANVEHVRFGERAKQKRWRQAHPDKVREDASVRSALRRARRKGSTIDDSAKIRLAFATLSKKARKLGLVIDHVIPLAPCRVCSAQGNHMPNNWQLLTSADNSSKGNRCQTCWMPNLMPNSGHVLS
jgi:hypothetical protein